MSYRFREIRKGECVKVLDFAKAHGCTVESQALHHHLSLVAKKEGELVAAAMCVEQQPCQFTIEIVHHEGAEPPLITELTDRCLRKVQSENITSARINSPAETATQTIWQSANWLDRIQETPPPADEAAEDEDASFQAA